MTDQTKQRLDIRIHPDLLPAIEQIKVDARADALEEATERIEYLQTENERLRGALRDIRLHLCTAVIVHAHGPEGEAMRRCYNIAHGTLGEGE